MTNPLRFLHSGESNRWPFLFLAAAVFAAYGSVWPNEFVFDDVTLIVNNAFLKNGSDLPQLLTGLNEAGSGKNSGFYRPVPMLLHFSIVQAFGLSTVAFHALNLSLHALNACLLFLLGLRIGCKRGVAFAGALLWALHPLHTEAVAYMAATPELLWSTFALSGLLALFPDFTLRRIYTSALFFVLALGCKESAVVFPALAAACLFLVSPERTRFTPYIKTWPLWLISALYITGWLLFMRETGYDMNKVQDSLHIQLYDGNLLNRVYTCLATVPVYFKLILWPSGLHMERNFPIHASFFLWPVVTGAALVILAVAQVLWGRARRGLFLSFGILWFATAQSPNTGIVIPINAFISEHWMYLPTMGLFLGVAATAGSLLTGDKKNLAAALVLTLAMALGVKTWLQAEIWRNSVSLYENIFANHGRSSRAHNNLGIHYAKVGDFAKAAEHFQASIDDPALRPPSEKVSLYQQLATALLGAGADEEMGGVTVGTVEAALPHSSRTPEAIAAFEKALEIDPDSYWPNRFLSVIYAYQGDGEKAARYAARADEIMQGAGR